MFKSIIVYIRNCGTSSFAAFNPCCIYILSTYPQLVKKQFFSIVFCSPIVFNTKGITNLFTQNNTYALSERRLELHDSPFVQFSVATHLLNEYDAEWNVKAVLGRR